MRKYIVLVMLVAGLTVLWGCNEAPKVAPRTIESVKSDILTKTDDVNSYLSAHNLVNTKTGAMAKQLLIFSEDYQALAMEAEKMSKNKPDPAMDELMALAKDGVTKTKNISNALEGNPNTNPAAFAVLKTAIVAWADYTDKSILMATGKSPAATATAPPGTATTPPSTDAAAPDQPGVGKHYGWWKNPNWANDPASRPNTNPPPGQVVDDDTKGQSGSDKAKDKGKPDESQGGGSDKGNPGKGRN